MLINQLRPLLFFRPYLPVAVFPPISTCCCFSALIYMLLFFNQYLPVAVFQPTSTCCCFSAYIYLLLFFQPTSTCCCFSAYIYLLLFYSPYLPVAASLSPVWSWTRWSCERPGTSACGPRPTGTCGTSPRCCHRAAPWRWIPAATRRQTRVTSLTNRPLEKMRVSRCRLLAVMESEKQTTKKTKTTDKIGLFGKERIKPKRFNPLNVICVRACVRACVRVCVCVCV